MSVSIKNMDMPKNCDECLFSGWSNLHQTAACKLLEYEPCFADFSREYESARSVKCPLVAPTIEPSAQPEPHWIPCSKRLPDEETDVLVTRMFLGCKDGSHGWNAHIPPTTYVEVARYFDGEWTALSDEYKVARSRHTNPIAWMPLPEPYKEDKE